MFMNECFFDEELGNIYIIRNQRSRRIIARRKAEGITLTVPLLYTDDMIKRIFEELKPRLLLLPSPKQKIWNEQSELHTFSFTLKISRQSVKEVYAGLKDKVLNIIIPDCLDIYSDHIQQKIGNYIESALRVEANKLLPAKVRLLANSFQFGYLSVKINKSKTRWGSCSSKKAINLSIYCLLLPQHLIDFIILHELCHTLEMNHGQKFWAHLDRVTNGNAKSLTQELKKYQTNII